MVDDLFSRSYDAIIIGGGPGGAACGHALASAGRSAIILDRQTFPRDKSCGDGLTPYSLRLLDEMGVLGRLKDGARMVGVGVIHMGAKERRRDFDYTGTDATYDYGLVVPRMLLDNAILDQACQAGCGFLGGARVDSLIEEEGRVAGVRYSHEGQSRELRAPFIVAANGAASAFRTPLRDETMRMEPGFAMRAYVAGLRGPFDRQEIYLPLADPSDQYLLPSYGWMFPTGPDSANVGVGIFSKLPFDNVRSLFNRFLDWLRKTDPRFTGASVGKPLGAPLRFDFSPECCAMPGLLLVGEAAGLTSPFTGEGISYAMESGRLAANAITQNLVRSPDSFCAESDYALMVENKFAGYFEAGRRSAQRYQLTWQVLDASFDNDRPMFSLFRRAALIPEGTGVEADGMLLRDLSSIIPPGDSLLHRQMIAIAARLVGTVRQDWPIVARLELARKTARSQVFRPSLLALLAMRLGNPASPHAEPIGAALDLVFMGVMAQTSVEEDTSAIKGDGNWSNKFAVLSGDYLMARGLELAAPVGHEFADLVIGAIECSCRAQFALLEAAGQASLSPERLLDLITRSAAPSFLLPLQIGARLADAETAHNAVLDEFGKALALLWVLADDIQRLRAQATDPVPIFATAVERGIPSLPILLASQHPGVGAKVQSLFAKRAHSAWPDIAGLVLQSDALARTYAQMEQTEAAAQAIIRNLPLGPARKALSALARLPLDATKTSGPGI